jgi:hypothetical protein
VGDGDAEGVVVALPQPGMMVTSIRIIAANAINLFKFLPPFYFFVLKKVFVCFIGMFFSLVGMW